MQHKTYDTAVVGGGLSGMIAALELARAGESVILYEAETELGGVAKSMGYDQNFDELSFQWFGDFYCNLRHVVDQLGMEWPDTTTTIRQFPRVRVCAPTLDDLRSIIRLLRAMISLTPKSYQRISWYTDLRKTNISPWAMVSFGRINKLGFDYSRIPYFSILRMLDMSFPMRATLRVAPLPIREYLIRPLQRRLEHLGVTIRLNTRVKSLNPTDLNARAVVAAIPPVAYTTIDTSNLYSFAVRKMNKLKEETLYQRISFRIFFKTTLKYPSRSIFDLHESQWGLLIMPAELYYTGQEWTSSVWSGTVTYMQNTDRFGKTPGECTAKEFEQSVLLQLLECNELHEWFAQARTDSRRELTNISNFSVWKTWGKRKEDICGTLSSTDFTTINSFTETWSRSMAGSTLGPNVFLAGAHAGTGCEVYLMEAAAEAGKRAAIAVLQSKNKNTDTVVLDKHERRITLLTCFIAMAVAGLMMFMVIMTSVLLS
jgi:hypothetical protein